MDAQPGGKFPQGGKVSARNERAYNVDVELTGKAALVTGGARRIGRAIVLALARAGADVMVHYNRSVAQAEATAQEVRALGVRAETIRAELAAPAEIEAMFATVAESFGRLNVLVNNAATFERTPLDQLTAEQWDAQMAVNARAPALCMRHAVPLMADGGVIINVTDIAAEKPWAGYPAYCASKAALVALTKSAAKSLAGRNIRVNAVAPGVVEWTEGTTEQEKDTVLAQVPLRRIGSAEDVAAVVVFLARSDYITGQNIRVDGGWNMG